MASITVLVTAPVGSKGYCYLEELVAQAGGEPVEFILADARTFCVDHLKFPVRRLSMPGRSVQGLIDEGIKQAKGDWILLTEDHCRPMPGLYDAYRKAVSENPGIDLFSGGVENLTSTAPWSFANFLAGLNHVWPSAQAPTADASNANLLVRRSAVQADEISTDGGFLARTISRLVAEGRQKNCFNARVDHIVHVSGPMHGMEIEYEIVTAAQISRRAVLPPRPILIQLARDFLAIFYYVLVSPWRITAHLRGTPQFSLGTVARLSVLGFAIGFVPLIVDLKLLFSAEPPLKPAG